MDICFRTNLDEAKPYLPSVYSTDVIPIPQINTLFRLMLPNGHFFDLKVVEVVYDLAIPGRPVVVVELHIPNYFVNIREWMDWFEKRRKEHEDRD